LAWAENPGRESFFESALKEFRAVGRQARRADERPAKLADARTIVAKRLPASGVLFVHEFQMSHIGHLGRAFAVCIIRAQNHFEPADERSRRKGF